MKQKSNFTFFRLAIFFIVFHLFSIVIYAQPIKITMTINYDLWTAEDPDWYNAITFFDDTQEDSLRNNEDRKGRSFKTNVGNRRATPFFWSATVVDNKGNTVDDVDVILVSVTRKPLEGGDIILDQTWYNSKDGGKTIRGITRQVFSGGRPDPNDPERNVYQESYIIDFALRKGKDKYDTFTVDPIIRGHN
jgi:hypothetical protein